MRVRVWARLLFAAAAIGLAGRFASADGPDVPQPASSASPEDETNPQVTMNYPEAERGDVVDVYHGTSVADPYRWLEDVESEATAAWVEAENIVTRRYLDRIPERKELRERLETLWNYERYGRPVLREGNVFYTHNDGLQNQSVLYHAAGIDAERRVLIDPNQLSEDGTIALAGWQPSDDGKLMAYGLADGGSDWRTWRVRDTASGEDLEDVVRWVKFSGIAWMPDSSGFFYGRYAEPEEGEELTGTNYNQKLYFHRLGTPQSEDQLIYERPDEKEWGFQPEVSQDGRWLVINNWKGSEPQSQIFLKDLQAADAPVEPLITGFDAEYEFIAADDEVLFFLTDNQASRRRVIAVEADNADRDAWRQVIAEEDDVLESVHLLGDRFFAIYLKHALSSARVFALDGSPQKEIELPGLGSVGGFGGLRDTEQTFYTFTNYVTPPSIYRFDLGSDASRLWRRPDVACD